VLWSGQPAAAESGVALPMASRPSTACPMFDFAEIARLFGDRAEKGVNRVAYARLQRSISLGDVFCLYKEWHGTASQSNVFCQQPPTDEANLALCMMHAT
jgi:hypothetical protein